MKIQVNLILIPQFGQLFVWQPGIKLNLNVTNWFRLGSGISYRYAGGVELEGTSDKALGNFLVPGLAF